MRQVLVALAYLHSRKVLHRDIKAENLRLTRPTSEWVHDLSRLKVKIIDFGLSCVQGEGSEVGWLGTPGYVAPEVIDRKPHTPAMDVYAAGVILFILLTGASPPPSSAPLCRRFLIHSTRPAPSLHIDFCGIVAGWSCLTPAPGLSATPARPSSGQHHECSAHRLTTRES